MKSFDVSLLRKEFPSLALTQGGQPVVYFDGPGGTQVPQRVIDGVGRYYREMNSNTEGAFVTTQRTDEMLAEAHQYMADFLNAGRAEEIAFGLNMTSHTFNVSRAIGKSLRHGDEVVVTVLDHEANVSPWVVLAEQGVKVHTVDISDRMYCMVS